MTYDFGYLTPQIETNKISMSINVRILRCVDVNIMTFSTHWVFKLCPETTMGRWRCFRKAAVLITEQVCYPKGGRKGLK